MMSVYRTRFVMFSLENVIKLRDSNVWLEYNAAMQAWLFYF